ncbi:hypothetical protein RAS12_25135 [Achromobacter seleniivolatilans]|uniref:Uncharacterized protein n=1 Tax=Achromobacter seleniivolatilans TaxID=3047478 RepID=A0ABY9M002_9BURK|nr:hypothetical protein [Achromobacter sp. R39]WMD19864.1 hypothetical protein RAS12_25135 [Achromobacter sp. R39]
MRVSSVEREWGEAVDQASALAAVFLCLAADWDGGRGERLAQAADAWRAAALGSGRAEIADTVVLPVISTWLSPACYAASCRVFLTLLLENVS